MTGPCLCAFRQRLGGDGGAARPPYLSTAGSSVGSERRRQLEYGLRYLWVHVSRALLAIWSSSKGALQSRSWGGRGCVRTRQK